MREASFGYPSDDPDEIVWVTLYDIVNLQGTDPKKWKTQPFCPHCKVPLRAYAKRDTKNFHLAKLETTDPLRQNLSRAQVGFAHIPETALKDCPYSYADHPLFVFPKSRNTGARETKENRRVLAESKRVEALQELLRCLVQRVTHTYKISKRHQKRLNKIKNANMDMRGLKEHSFLMPVIQILMDDPYLREVPELMVEEQPIAAPSLFGKAAAAVQKRVRKKPVLSVCWRPFGTQTLPYMSVNGESRSINFAASIVLCSVHKKDGGVVYRQLRHQNGKELIKIEVSREAAWRLVEPYFDRKARREGLKKITNNPDKPLQPKKKKLEGQTEFDLRIGPKAA